MPIYEFHCESCHEYFEVLAGNPASSARCPHCDSRETTKIASVVHYRNADHWESNMLKGISMAKENDRMKAELKPSA